MYSLLQLSKSYLSSVDEEISLPSPTADGDTLLNELQVYIHVKSICSTATLTFSLTACKSKSEIPSKHKEKGKLAKAVCSKLAKLLQ